MGLSLTMSQRTYLAGDHCPALSCTSIDTLAYPPNCQGGPGWSPACRSPVCGDRVRSMYSTPSSLTGLISPASEPSSTELPITLILSCCDHGSGQPRTIFFLLPNLSTVT